MANVKDIQLTIEYTTDNPFEVADPTYTEIPALRLDGDSAERPTDEPEDSELQDGRTDAGGHMLSAAYGIKESTDGAQVISALEDAEGSRPVWFRETDMQPGTTPQVIGGPKGCAIQVGDDSQGFGGDRVRPVSVTATAAQAGVLRQDDPNAA